MRIEDYFYTFTHDFIYIRILLYNLFIIIICKKNQKLVLHYPYLIKGVIILTERVTNNH